MGGRVKVGTVYRAFDETREQEVAWKRVIKVSKQFPREIEVLYELRKERGCVKMLDFFFSSDADVMVHNMLFEYLPYNLEKYLDSKLNN